MKRTYSYRIVAIILVAGILAFSKVEKGKMKINTADSGFALIELFTSEGCYSCPPADKAAEEIQKQYADKNVLVLGYHVDYWDRLGWKDIFSSHDYTSRQEYYAKLFNLESIYTPQVVVNGTAEFVGSDKNKLVNSVDEQLKENISPAIRIKATQAMPGNIEITYSAEGDHSKQEELIILLVQKTATNNIMKGENEGRTLHHVNIVRKLSEFSIPSKEQKTTFQLPSELKKEDIFVAAFLQNKKTGKICGIQSSQVN